MLLINEYGMIPLHVIASEGRVDAISVLVELGANLHTPSHNGVTHVYMAAQEGHVNAIRALVEFGANMNTPDTDSYTPVYVAAYMGHVDTIRVLVELGANPNTPDNYGDTPVHASAYKSQVDAIRALVELRANIDIISNDVASPLSSAARRGHKHASTFSVNIGADVKKCLQALKPEQNDHIREMMSQFFDSMGLQVNVDIGFDEKCSLFSLTKLMSSASSDNILMTMMHTQRLLETTNHWYQLAT
jgi:hypothetical protein